MKKQKKLGLIGFPLGHSFSAAYFASKFEKLSLDEWSYENFEIENIDTITEIIKNNPTLLGFNVTIPHKLAIIPFLSEIDERAAKIGAVNCVKLLKDGGLKGYNTDFDGFKASLLDLIGEKQHLKAIVLGNGGASRAVTAVLESLSIEYLLVSRTKTEKTITYDEIDENIMSEHKLIINTTPLGMSPKIDAAPAINYDLIDKKNYLFDLIYKPEETLFMKKGKLQGAKVKNGYDMLIGQAEAWWKIIYSEF